MKKSMRTIFVVWFVWVFALFGMAGCSPSKDEPPEELCGDAVGAYFITDERTGETSSHSTNTLQVVLVTTFSVILSKEFGNFTISSLGMSVHYLNSISKLSIITIRG